MMRTRKNGEYAGVAAFEARKAEVVRINAPAWFAREDFRRVLRSPGVATWHAKDRAEPGAYSDLFVTYDWGEGSNAPVGGDGPECLPDDIWQAIDEICVDQNIGNAVIWITNRPE